MAFERAEASTLDYEMCHYGQSKLLFRGPKKSLKGNYMAFVGSSETFGKYVADPYVSRVEREIDFPCVNFSAVNAGVDAFFQDESLVTLCSRSKLTVIQVMGAQNMSNRFYTVHARRNDRFLRASALLQTIYRELDFTDFSFTRHMLGTLKSVSPTRFQVVEEELRSAWVARMTNLLGRIRGPKALLWLKETDDRFADPVGLGGEPLFLNEESIRKVSQICDELIEVPMERPRGNLNQMQFPFTERASAEQMLSVSAHRQIADELSDRVAKYK